MANLISDELLEQIYDVIGQRLKLELINEMPPRGRWHGSRAGGSGSASIVRFRIDASYFCGSCFVDATVLGIPDGTPIRSLPEIDEAAGNTLTVYDKDGCFFNEPPEDLVNRTGYAVYMNHLEDGPCPDMFGSLWTVISLCCSEEVCG